jgi:hypothetical protein
MSVHISSRVWKLQLRPPEKLVLLKLADCCDDEGANAFPSVSRIARECGMSDRTVQRSLALLRSKGLVSVQAEHDCAGRFPTTYKIHPERGDTVTPGVTNTTDPGDTVTPDLVTTTTYPGVRVSPKPSLEPSVRSLEGAPAEKQPSPFAFSGVHIKITARQDRLLRDAFPWADHSAEYKRMDAWAEANPGRRPRNPGRFAHNWLARMPAPIPEPEPITELRAPY